MGIKVLIGGFPNSGTSFLCSLIVHMGFSPGNPRDLKKSDSHNRYGYYENLKIRNETWKILKKKEFIPWKKNFFLDNQTKLNNKKKKKLIDNLNHIIIKDRVAVYKDNALPLVYELFDKNAKIIIIERNNKDIYQSPQKSGETQMQFSFLELINSKQKYNKLVDKMSLKRQVLILKYENFDQNFEKEVNKIIKFLKLKKTDIKISKKIFKPRKKPFLEKYFNFFIKKGGEA